MQGSLPGLNGIRIKRQPISAQYRRAVPLTAAALRQLGQIALSQQDWQEAIDLFSQAVEEEEKPISGMLLLGMALRRAGREEEARGMLDQVLSMDPLNHLALRAWIVNRRHG